ncbi:MAG: 30S ribosomal protein S6 [bacterium]|nr:30S ribosomal protein S6 [bacterium]
MRKYELVVLAKTNLAKAQDKLPDLFKKLKVKILETDNLGERDLAYPIQKQTKAVYTRYLLEAKEDFGKQLDRFFHLNSKSYLRYLLVARDKK